MHATPRGTQQATRGILRSLFPSWLPPAFAAMFSRPLPGLSCQVGGWAVRLQAPVQCCRGRGRRVLAQHVRPALPPPPAAQLNAWATWATCQWLMGECEVNDVEVDGGRTGAAHGVLIKRCGRGLVQCQAAGAGEPACGGASPCCVLHVPQRGPTLSPSLCAALSV